MLNKPLALLFVPVSYTHLDVYKRQINGTGKTGKIVAIHASGLTPAQLRRSKTVEVEGNEGKFEP